MKVEEYHLVNNHCVSHTFAGHGPHTETTLTSRLLEVLLVA